MPLPVIPAQVGIQDLRRGGSWLWIPAGAGMTDEGGD
jgi:hypothetical protein